MSRFLKYSRRAVVTALVATVTALVATTVVAQDWMTDYDQALEKAKEEDKPVLLNFTGSDWCVYCIALKKEVFDTKEFKEFAKKNLVLLEIDFPRNKPLSAKVMAQNRKLAQEFKVMGPPLVLILDEKGKELDRGGYEQNGYAKGGFKAFVQQFKTLKDLK